MAVAGLASAVWRAATKMIEVSIHRLTSDQARLRTEWAPSRKRHVPSRVSKEPTTSVRRRAVRVPGGCVRHRGWPELGGAAEGEGWDSLGVGSQERRMEDADGVSG